MRRSTRSSFAKAQLLDESVKENKSSTRTTRPAVAFAEVTLRNITNTEVMSTRSLDRPTRKSPPQIKRVTADVEPAPKRQRTDSNSPESEAASSSHPELIAFEKLQFVLGRHYFDVCQRLTLDYVPRCVRNVGECAQQHANKRAPRTKRVGVMRQNSTIEQIPEHRPDQFVEFLNQALMRCEFIDSELFVAGLQLILTINRPSTELQVDYNVPAIVSGTSAALEKCLERFPPCRWDLRSTYHSIVFGHLDATCFKKCDRKEGLFRNVVHLLEFYIETGDPDDQSPRKQRKQGARKTEREQDDAFFSNYSCWMTQNRQIYDFDRLSREERFGRLFTVLRILVRLLEMDLAMWILRNPTKTRQHLCHPSRCPLVAQLVWEGNHGSVNLFVKKLFGMFVNMTALHYPDSNVAVFSRLLNLVAVSVNLSEFQHNDGMLQYPCLKTNSQYFAKQFWKALESSPYFSVALCLDALRLTRTPYLLLSLTEQLVQKLNRHSHPANVRGFFQHFITQSWLECDDNVDEQPRPEVAVSSVRYPVLNPHKSRVRCSEISRQQYVDLLCVGFRAYCDMYQIPAYFRAIMVHQPNTQPKVEGQSTGVSEPTTQPDLSPSALGPYIREQVSSVDPGTMQIVAQNTPDARMIFQGVAVSGELMLEYREDIKYLMLIEQQLKKLETREERTLFRQWITFLSDVDPSLNISL